MAEPAPIPAFYCCYLLRARNRKSYYIGSTPNPARRLAQHNGKSKGGAKRTSLESKRPWEMTCLVTGFPSKFAALQFEWAWQNTYITRHIERDDREPKQKPNKAGPSSPPKKRSRPPMSLEARLKNLMHLLGVKSFKRWPLQLRFFATDVFELWRKYMAKMAPELGKRLLVQHTPFGVDANLAETSTGEPTYKVPDVIQEISVAYEDSKSHVEKGKMLLEGVQRHSCGVCRKKIDISSSLVMVCPVDTCSTLSHMGCLSNKFLREEGDLDAIIPVRGTCPGCRNSVKWSSLTKELSLRTRGQSEIEAMFKPKRRKKADNVTETEAAGADALDGDEEDLDETWIEDVEDVDDELPSIETILGTKARK